MKTPLYFVLLLSAAASLHAETVEGTPAPPSQSIPFDQLGAEAQKQYSGDGISITPTADGAKLRAIMQDLEAQATPEGMWLTSTADEDAGKPNRFRVRAASISRASPAGMAQPTFVLSATGEVQATKDSVLWLRPGLAEEYSVSTDGVRQDFVVVERPPGAGELTVGLEVAGAVAQQAGYGATLTLDATGRELAYHRLRVSDASGRELTARLEVLATDRLCVVVEDAGAVYPVRIDPTFSDVDWLSLSPGLPGADGSVYALFADGSGNLYFGGDFTMIGSVVGNRIAKWDGNVWSSLGSGMDERVYSLAILGGNLYAGGDFTTAGGVAAGGIAKWNGTAWSALGTGLGNGGEGFAPSVYALASNGGNLFVGGQFVTAGGITSRGVAKWNGTTWSGLDSGVNGFVEALLVVGGDVIVGGGFQTAGVAGLTVNSIARWNGSAWSALSSGMTGGSSFPVVYSLASNGGVIYAGGDFSHAGGVSSANIAQWNGALWSALGSGTDDVVLALANFGGELVVAGPFSTAGGATARGIAKWNGVTWSAVGGDADDGAFGIYVLAVSGDDLFAGGYFSALGGVPAKNTARWNGSVWSALGSGMDGSVGELAVSGGTLYVAGDFTTVGGVAANRIAKWDGSAWSALGSGLSSGVFGAEVAVLLADGSNLFAGGRFTSAGGVAVNQIAQWNGSSWSALGTGISGGFIPVVRALAMIGGELHAGGSFSSAGGVSVSNIAKWNGSTWVALGAGVGSVGNSVNAMVASGSDLYIGGSFSTTGGVPANGVAKWDGLAWSALGSGVNVAPNTLVVMGGDLYAGGQFTTAGGNPASYIAKWSGSTWSPLGSGLNGLVYALAAQGGNLYAGGNFSSAGGTPANFIAQWDGSSWSALGSGTDNLVRALAATASGQLIVGGDFRLAGASVSNFLAQVNIDSTTAPDIAVAQAAPVADGGSVAFGSVVTGGSSSPIGFTITNPGNADLTSLVITKDGTDHADFTLSALSATSIPVGPGTATFTVTFSPTSSGAKTATLHIASNVSGSKNPYDITLTGTGITPEQAANNTIANAGLTGSDATLTATPHNDGVENLLKYAFNMNLAGPDVHGMVSGGSSGLPEVLFPLGTIRIEFVRRIGSGLIYTPQMSSTLTPDSWDSLTIVPIVTPIDAEWERVVYDQPYDALFFPQCFGRVQVTLPP